MTGAGWYAAGDMATVTATANTGFTFSEFSTPFDRPKSTLLLNVNSATTVTADFCVPGAFLTAITTGQRNDAAVGVRNVPLSITNPGAGGFGDVQVTGIDTFQTVAGTGTVQSQTSLPVRLGDISPSGAGSFNTILAWPATATRVSFKVHFVANGGAYTGSTTLTVNR